MTTTQTTGTVSPLVHDTKTAELHEQAAKLARTIASNRDKLHRMAGDRQRWVGKKQRWQLTDAEVSEKINALVAAGDTYVPMYRCQPSHALEALQGLERDMHILQVQIGRMEDTYRQHGWTRYFPCTNADGHIHSSLGACPSVRITTAMAWTPSLSGKTVEEAVKELGPLLCSICFPSAPVEWCKSKSELNAKPVCPGGGHGPVTESIKRRGMRAWGKCRECAYHGQLTSYGLVRKHEPTEA